MERDAGANGQGPARAVETATRADIASPPIGEVNAQGTTASGARHLHPAGLGGRAPARTRVALEIDDVRLDQEVLDLLERDPRIDIVMPPAGRGEALVDIESVRSRAVAAPGRLQGLSLDPVPEPQGDGAPFVDVIVASPESLDAPFIAGRTEETVLLVVASDVTVEGLRRAIARGAAGMFEWPQERSDLVASILRAAPRPGHGALGRGRVLAVCGTRGGVGATFVATHLAASAAEAGRSCVLVDMDVASADLTVALGIDADRDVRTVADLVPVLDELDPEHVEDALFHHEAGFAALLAPRDAQATPVPPGLYRGAVALLACSFEVVILHLPRTADELARSGADLADVVALVTSLDLFSLYGARRKMAWLGLTLEASGRARLVVNRPGRPIVTRRDAVRVLGGEPHAWIRADQSVRRAQASGQLLPARHRRAGADVRALLRSLLSGERAGQAERGEVQP